MTNSTAALLDSQGNVIAEVRNAPEGNTIDIAGAETIDGDPVNVRTYKLSRSLRNLKKAANQYGLVTKDNNDLYSWCE